MSEYQANSHRSKELAAQEQAQASEKKMQKVVKGNVKTRSNDGRKLANIFISEDAANVKSYIFMDVLVPAIKKAVSDIVRDGIDMILYGESGGRDRGRSRSGDRVSYRSYYDDRDRRGSRYDDDRRGARSGGGRFDYDDIIFETRGDAERVKDNMLDTCEHYGVVTVLDMYDMAALTAPPTAGRYGWMGLRYIDVQRVRDGYILKLPKAMPID